MNSEIVIPQRIAGRVEVKKAPFIALSDFFGRKEMLSTAYRRGDGTTVTYVLELERGDPGFDDDLDAFLTLKAGILVAMVRESSVSVKTLSFIDHRIIDEYASAEDRRFLRREYLQRRLVSYDDDGWNDAVPAARATRGEDRR
jgi:hypothetical protein